MASSVRWVMCENVCMTGMSAFDLSRVCLSCLSRVFVVYLSVVCLSCDEVLRADGVIAVRIVCLV